MKSNCSLFGVIVCGIDLLLSAVAVTWRHPILPQQSYSDYFVAIMHLKNVPGAIYLQIFGIVGNVHLIRIYNKQLYYGDFTVEYLSQRFRVTRERAMALSCNISAAFTVLLATLAMFAIVTAP
jgi:hypothetical protein